MSEQVAAAPARQAAAPERGSKRELMVQRKCDCGQHTLAGSECVACRKKRLTLQRWSTARPGPVALLNASQSPTPAARINRGRGLDLSGVPVHAPALRTSPAHERATAGALPAPEATPSAGASPESKAPLLPGVAPEGSREASAAASPGTALIVEDDVTDLQPGQIRRSEFLDRLQPVVCSEAEAALAGTEHSTEGCPYISFWFGYYRNQSSDHIQRALHRYVPEVRSARSAAEYIPAIAAQVRRAVAQWVRTGEVTGVPDGEPGPAAAQAAAARTGKTPGAVQLKARDRTGRPSHDPIEVQKKLGAGRPLDSGVRSRMEHAFGRSFSAVRLHMDETARRLSSEQDARAFTVGEHIAFGSGEYRPGTILGDALIAHELAHVVQQNVHDSPTTAQHGRANSRSLEEDADRSALGAIAALWGQTRPAGWYSHVAPRVKSGLALARCKAATPRLSLSNDTYVDTAAESRKNIRFDVTVPSGLNAKDYALVNWVKGSMKDGSGNFFTAQMYGSVVNADYPSWQVDSVDPDPIYWSQPGTRWNYNNTPNGFYATDSPGPALNTEHGAVYALNFKIGLYKMSDLPATTSGSISATPIEQKPWQYSVKVDAAGSFTHPPI